MAPESVSQAIQLPLRRVRRQSPSSPGWVKFLVSWLFGWPLLVFTYNPLTAPYDPLTLFIVIPGGAIWLFSCGFGCVALIAMAETRWPVTRTILEILSVVLRVLWNILLCIP
jgi:hypothetical protein